MILALDPGNKDTAFVLFDERERSIRDKGKVPNVEVASMLRTLSANPNYAVLAIENIQSFGMPVGREIFDTCVWIGRFVEMSKAPLVWPVYRTQVKAAFCPHTPNDSGIRAAMCERYGGDPKKNKQAGMLTGVKADIWSALAIATFVSDQRRNKVRPPRDPAFLLKISGFSLN